MNTKQPTDSIISVSILVNFNCKLYFTDKSQNSHKTTD